MAERLDKRLATNVIIQSDPSHLLSRHVDISRLLLLRAFVVCPQAHRRLGSFLGVGLLLQLLDSNRKIYQHQSVVCAYHRHTIDSPPLVRLAPPVRHQRGLHIVPLGTFYAVMPSQSGQVFDQLGVFVLLQVLGRQKVRLDLVEVPEWKSVMSVTDGKGAESHRLYRRVLVSVFLFSMPILKFCVC